MKSRFKKYITAVLALSLMLGFSGIGEVRAQIANRITTLHIWINTPRTGRELNNAITVDEEGISVQDSVVSWYNGALPDDYTETGNDLENIGLTRNEDGTAAAAGTDYTVRFELKIAEGYLATEEEVIYVNNVAVTGFKYFSSSNKYLFAIDYTAQEPSNTLFEFSGNTSVECGDAYTYTLKPYYMSGDAKKYITAPVTYSSTNTEVADVDSATGSVTIKSPGVFSIHAVLTAANNVEYSSATKDIEITVTAKRPTDINVSFSDSDTYYYDGRQWKPKFRVTYGDTVLTEGADYSIGYPEDLVNVGEKTFTISTSSGYGSQTKTIKGYIKKEAPAEAEPETNSNTEYTLPENPYTIEANPGQNGYYTSYVPISAHKDFLISTNDSGTFFERMIISESVKINYLYFKPRSGGTVTKKKVDLEIKIDALKPVISGIKNNQSIIGGEVEITVSDENLFSVTLNGKAVEIENNKAAIFLKEGKETQKYQIEAKDYAGNREAVSFSISPYTGNNNEITVGKVELKKGTEYILGKGNWKISGDSTVYEGRNIIFVKEDGEYDFYNV